MKTLQQVEEAVRSLPPQELSAFREWFLQFDADTWDQQLERDAAAGRLDRFAEEAQVELHSRPCSVR